MTPIDQAPTPGAACAQRWAAINDPPPLATTHRSQARHDRQHQYQKIERHSAWPVHFTNRRTEMSKHPLSRRAILATAVATVPSLALPAAGAAAFAGGSSPADKAIFSLDLQLREAWQRLDTACDRRAIAEKAMDQWKKRNPMPVLREFERGPGAVTNEPNMFLKAACRSDDPSHTRAYLEVYESDLAYFKREETDETAAVKEYEKALTSRHARKMNAEANCNLGNVEATESSINKQITGLLGALCEVDAESSEALTAKARLANMTSDLNLACSVVRDVVKLGEAS
jgi:hypothetical protein